MASCVIVIEQSNVQDYFARFRNYVYRSSFKSSAQKLNQCLACVTDTVRVVIEIFKKKGEKKRGLQYMINPYPHIRNTTDEASASNTEFSRDTIS